MPVFVGLAGPSCGGKSTLARLLVERLSPIGAEVLAVDDYYRDLAHVPAVERSGWNFDRPGAIDYALLSSHVQELWSGRAIDAPCYDFALNVRGARTRRVAPAEVIVVEGILALHWAGLGRRYALRVYVDAEPAECLRRRVRRDVQERGRTAASVEAQFRTTVLPMYRRYVLPTRARSDVVLGGDCDPATAAQMLAERIRALLLG
jgi:uridine kinase